MKYLDTHTLYQRLQADLHLKSSETVANSLLEWLKEARQEFASQRFISILGGLILIALTAIGSELWYLSKEMSILNFKISHIEFREGR